MKTDTPDALVIGAGPAGLMAADRLVKAGHSVVMAESKPSPARKFLMAGKSGLNLTKEEPLEDFIGQYIESADWLRPLLARFGPRQVIEWAQGLGQPVFVGSSGRIFPTALKASPLLRAWLADLDAHGLDLRRSWRWTAFEQGRFTFETPDGTRTLTPRVAVLALGGASWPRLGSDGRWQEILRPLGIPLAPLKPANMGFAVPWSDHMTPHHGAPLKNIALIAGDQRHRGEAVITERGIEGGGIYAISRALRVGAPLTLDLFPDLTITDILSRLEGVSKKESTSNILRKKLKLTGARRALVLDCAKPLPSDPAALAHLLKALPIPITDAMPIAEAISSAGGIRHKALTDDLMLKALPGVFAAGEMLDWEAPTGGYLLTAAFATGRHAGDAAARYLLRDPGQDEPAAD